MSAGQSAIAVFCTFAAVTSLSGCAMMMEMRPAADSYVYDVGNATEQEFRSKTVGILTRYGYYIARDDGYPSLRIESQWKSRPPIDAVEENAGYEIISRITMTGSPRYGSGSVMYHLMLSVENRFVPTHGTSRDKRPVTASATYARTIVKEMTVAFGGAARPVANEMPPL